MEFARTDNSPACTRNSKSSHSSATSAAVKVHAKAEAAKARAVFAERKAKLKVGSAAKEAELHLAELHGPKAQASVHGALPDTVLSEMSYITWHPPSGHNSELQERQEEEETHHRPSDFNTPKQPFVSAPINACHTAPERCV